MILLDTNVISELLRPKPEPAVVRWVSEQPAYSLFTTTISRAELFYGLTLLDEGARRASLWAAVLSVLDVDFAGRVLSFDDAAAMSYARIAAGRRRAGRPISQADAMIAGIAVSRGAALATRNAKDFLDCGILVFNPWELA